MKRSILFCLTLLIYSSLISLSPGDLDPSFGSGNGYVSISLGSSTIEGASDVLVQPDRKIVICGLTDIGLSGGQFAAIRYLHNGDLDSSFGTAGRFTYAKGTDDGALGMVRQSNGGLLLTGYVKEGGIYKVATMRLTSSGQLDTTFGNSSGFAITDVGGVESTAWDIALQANGKFIVSGYWSTATDYSMVIIRYNSDGSLDTSFGEDGTGIVKLPIVAGNGSDAYSVTVQSDGKIVAVGFYGDPDGDSAIQLVRLTTTGRLDTGFGTNGIKRTAITSGYDAAYGVTIQSDNKILVAGVAEPAALVIRYNADGSEDTNVGTNGTGIMLIELGTDAYGRGIAIQADDKIVIGGFYFQSLSQVYGFIRRYTSSGSVDTTFGTQGTVITALNVAYEAITNLIMQPDGKIIAAGGSASSVVGAVVGTSNRRPITRNGGTVNYVTWRYIGEPVEVPASELAAARLNVPKICLATSWVDKAADFYALLRDKYYDFDSTSGSATCGCCV